MDTTLKSVVEVTLASTTRKDLSLNYTTRRACICVSYEASSVGG